MTAVIQGLDSAAYNSHALHSMERMWPETNCYSDLWIEVLSAQGLAPEALFGSFVTQDFEGDQFTFFKTPLEDIADLYGIRVTELAIYDNVEDHIVEQIKRGRLCLVEMDGYFLPDTQGVGYHQDHGKTTVAINRLDVENRTMDYFHNRGFFTLSGDDFDGIFHRNAADDAPLFLPYTEFVKFPEQPATTAHIATEAKRLLARHLLSVPTRNPVAAFASVFPQRAEVVADRPFAFFHKYAFNTLRQLGANFELLSAHLEWLGQGNEFVTAVSHAKRISEVSKSAQFQLARAVSRRKFEPLGMVMDPAVEAWDQLMADLRRDFR